MSLLLAVELAVGPDRVAFAAQMLGHTLGEGRDCAADGEYERALFGPQDDVKRLVDVPRVVADRARECSGVQVLGPAPAPIGKIKGNWRWHVLLKAADAAAVASAVRSVGKERVRGARLIVDVDPMSLL